MIPDIRGAYSYGNLREILPGELGTAIAEGISAFGRQIRGFDREGRRSLRGGEPDLVAGARSAG